MSKQNVLPISKQSKSCQLHCLYFAMPSNKYDYMTMNMLDYKGLSRNKISRDGGRGGGPAES